MTEQQIRNRLEPELSSAPADGWLALEVEPGECHVIPTGDVVEHTADCACLPDVTAVERQDGSMSYVFTHSAWDGRAW